MDGQAELKLFCLTHDEEWVIEKVTGGHIRVVFQILELKDTEGVTLEIFFENVSGDVTIKEFVLSSFHAVFEKCVESLKFFEKFRMRIFSTDDYYPSIQVADWVDEFLSESQKN